MEKRVMKEQYAMKSSFILIANSIHLITGPKGLTSKFEGNKLTVSQGTSNYVFCYKGEV